MKKILDGLKIKNLFKGFKLKKVLKIFNPKNLIKLFGFKNLLIAALVVAVVVLICFGIGGGFGGGAGSGEGSGNSKVMVSDENSTAKEVVEEVTSTSEPIEETSEVQDGKDVFDGAVLAINVVGNDYFYNNERISLEDFMAIAKDAEGKLVVEVKDDNASLKAYNNLLDGLDAVNIEYVEK